MEKWTGINGGGGRIAMTEMPALDPKNRNYISCPHCTIQIPAGVPDCPHCRQSVTGGASGKPKDIRDLLVPPERFPPRPSSRSSSCGWRSGS